MVSHLETDSHSKSEDEDKMVSHLETDSHSKSEDELFLLAAIEVSLAYIRNKGK